ncbi:hypothetical protein [Pirellulimonas nuda]|uniref:hypothetical protein n=1 Tax=Pirellulimonas nuda TaxID=2528009 RepID=UPI0011AAD4D4|nr:hypothetical protein [Pirellulimonas nuda]
METQNLKPTVVAFGDEVLDRMARAVEKVQERLRRSTAALEAAHVPYAAFGDNAVAAWVATIDPGAVRHAVDIEMLVNRGDYASAKKTLESVGFLQHDEMTFVDGADGSPREAVRLLFAGEKAKEGHVAAAPCVSADSTHTAFKLLPLEPLVLLELTLWRCVCRLHVRDLIEIGLVDQSWPQRFTPALAGRLQTLLDDPDG